MKEEALAEIDKITPSIEVTILPLQGLGNKSVKIPMDIVETAWRQLAYQFKLRTPDWYRGFPRETDALWSLSFEG